MLIEELILIHKSIITQFNKITLKININHSKVCKISTKVKLMDIFLRKVKPEVVFVMEIIMKAATLLYNIKIVTILSQFSTQT